MHIVLSKSIFIPIAGFVVGTSLTTWEDYTGSYNSYGIRQTGATEKTRIMWSSSSGSTNPIYLYATDKWTSTADPIIWLDDGGYWKLSQIGTKNCARYHGLQIRPIISYGN